MKQIIFYAPVGNKTPQSKIGGAEAGCLKTIQIYEGAGIDVILLPKPAISRGRIIFLIEMLFVPFKLFCLLRKYPHAVVHIVGFYTKIAMWEKWLMQIAHNAKHKVIYEFRNGSMIHTYKTGTKRYKNILKNLITKPDLVLCQGMEYVDFILKEWGIERSYYPNYIMDEFIIPNNLNRSYPIRLIYFGRVTESKNINIMIETLAEIKDAGIEAFLDIIGSYEYEYKVYLDKKVENMGLTDFVTFYGRRELSFIVERLRLSHYFIFPSQEKQEGHSNSLTEAMGCGVVPIVSSAGFNESVCGNRYLVVHNIDAKCYAEKIIEIEQKGKWKELSSEVYEHVLNNYTQSVVGRNLIKYVNVLFGE